MPRPVARWVLPVPGGPSSTTLRASVRNPPDASAAICWRTAGWASQSNSSMRLAGREPGGPDPQLGAGGVAGGDLTVQDGGEVLLVGPAGVAGVVGQPGGGFGDPGRLQRRGQVGQLLERLGGVALGLGCHQATSPSAGVGVDRGRRRGRSRPGPAPGRRRGSGAGRGCWNCSRSTFAAATWAGSVIVMPRAQTRSWAATRRPSWRTSTRSRSAVTSTNRPITAGSTE